MAIPPLKDPKSPSPWQLLSSLPELTSTLASQAREKTTEVLGKDPKTALRHRVDQGKAGLRTAATLAGSLLQRQCREIEDQVRAIHRHTEDWLKNHAPGSLEETALRSSLNLLRDLDAKIEICPIVRSRLLLGVAHEHLKARLFHALGDFELEADSLRKLLYYEEKLRKVPFESGDRALFQALDPLFTQSRYDLALSLYLDLSKHDRDSARWDEAGRAKKLVEESGHYSTQQKNRLASLARRAQEARERRTQGNPAAGLGAAGAMLGSFGLFSVIAPSEPTPKIQVASNLFPDLSDPLSFRQTPNVESSADAVAEVEEAGEVFRPHSPEVLEAWAQRDLLAYQERGAINPRLGEFVIHAGMNKLRNLEVAPIVLQNWEEHSAEIFAATAGKSPSRQIVAARDKDFELIGSYAKGRSDMVDFYNGGSGNCKANTECVVTDFLLGVQLRPGERLAIQAYHDHWQPVIYNTKTGLMTNLISGERTKRIEAPLYAPPYLQYRYLADRGITPPVPLESLLIAKRNIPDSELRTVSLKTPEQLRALEPGWAEVPEGGASVELGTENYYGGAVPEAGRIIYYKLGEKKASDPLYREETASKPALATEDVEADAADLDIDEESKYSFRFDKDPKPEFYFNHSPFQENYEALKSRQEKRNFFIQVAGYEAVANFLEKNPNLIQTTRRLKSPRLWSTIKADEFNQISRLILKVSLAADDLAAFDHDTSNRDIRFSKLSDLVEKRNATYAYILQELRHFARQIRNNPQALFRAMEALDIESKKKLQSLIVSRLTRFSEFKDLSLFLAQLLRDKGKVKIESERYTYYEVDLTQPSGLAQPVTESETPAEKRAEETRPASSPKISFSTQAYVELILFSDLFFSEESLNFHPLQPIRWTPEINRDALKYLKENSDRYANEAKESAFSLLIRFNKLHEGDAQAWQGRVIVEATINYQIIESEKQGKPYYHLEGSLAPGSNLPPEITEYLNNKIFPNQGGSYTKPDLKSWHYPERLSYPAEVADFLATLIRQINERKAKAENPAP